ncbi:MAG TPA: metallophosphoesterase family protein [Planctomycetota bacterium]|nr:metallophosphoesterase family protein [Planctomycetota bacterium]
MKVGVIGDIHGNLEALTSVLEALDGEKVDTIVCVGDIVGYGADPEACIALVRERASAVVAGNHDYGVVGKQALDYFNPAARTAIHWTAKRLSEEDRGWLSGLPLVHECNEYELVHASLFQPGEFRYIFNPEEAGPSFARQKAPVAFFGHTHWPMVFFDGEPVRHSIQRVIPLEPPGKVLVNAGSVGQPRDSNPAAGYTVLDLEEERVHLKRIDYDVRTTAKKILDAGLPAFLAERLSLGY